MSAKSNQWRLNNMAPAAAGVAAGTAETFTVAASMVVAGFTAVMNITAVDNAKAPKD
jgi:hypothetical protein